MNKMVLEQTFCTHIMICIRNKQLLYVLSHKNDKGIHIKVIITFPEV